MLRVLETLSTFRLAMTILEHPGPPKERDAVQQKLDNQLDALVVEVEAFILRGIR